MRVGWLVLAVLVASSCTDVVDAKKKKKKKKAKGRTGGAVLLDDESFDGAIKDKGAFVKFLAPW
jgi:uncharacterized protein YceK